MTEFPQTMCQGRIMRSAVQICLNVALMPLLHQMCITEEWEHLVSCCRLVVFNISHVEADRMFVCAGWAQGFLTALNEKKSSKCSLWELCKYYGKLWKGLSPLLCWFYIIKYNEILQSGRMIANSVNLQAQVLAVAKAYGTFWDINLIRSKPSLIESTNHYYSIKHQMWINPPLKIVPNKSTISCCLFDKKLQSAAVGTWLNLFFFYPDTIYLLAVLKDFPWNQMAWWVESHRQEIRKCWETENVAGFGLIMGFVTKK